MTIPNTDRSIIKWIAERTAVGAVVARHTPKEGYAPVYMWRCFGSAAISLLRQMYPLLEIKKPIAALLLDAAQDAQARRQFLYDPLWRSELLGMSKALNRRGVIGAALRADLKMHHPELRGGLIHLCTKSRSLYEPRNILGVLASLESRQPDKNLGSGTGCRICPVCGATFVVDGPISPKSPYTTCSRSCGYRYRGRTTRPCLMLSRDLARGLAALIDAEGNIRVKRNSGTIAAEVGFGNTDRGVVELMRRATGLGVVTPRQPKRATHAEFYYWCCGSQGAQGLLEQIRPFLKIKRRQADLALYAQERRRHAPSRYGCREWQIEVLTASRRLNTKGKRRAVPPIVLDGGLLVI
ncbi:MAG: hypothetical protein LLG20_24985 [Acidobacteriales bacterium]|nr:hypothetical protein [Terriglobales bacterium]